MKNITHLNVDFNNLPKMEVRHDDERPRKNRREGGRPTKVIPDTGSKIYMQDHLTKYSKAILKATKANLEGPKFKYPAYVMDGEVRCKTAQGEDYTVIRCMSDLKKVMVKHDIPIDDVTIDYV